MQLLPLLLRYGKVLPYQTQVEGLSHTSCPQISSAPARLVPSGRQTKICTTRWTYELYNEIKT